MNFRIVVALIAAVAVLAGCGDDGGDGSSGGGGAAAAATDGFPVTIEHKRGSTTVDAAPERVVSIGFKDQDFIIALGVMPIGVREWFGGKEGALWPWARAAFEGEDPEVLEGEQIPYERIAALGPDLITAIYGGLTQEEYDRLAQIAPTVAQPKGMPDYSVSWQEQTRITGEALGRTEQAEQAITDVEDQFARAREEHPELAGKSAVYGYAQAEGLGAYPAGDPRARFLEDLGLETPPRINELAGDQFFVNISGERLDLLDADVLVMSSLNDDPSTSRAAVEKTDPLYARIGAVEDGRDVYPDEETAGALSFSSPLSLPVALQKLVPALADAVAR